MKSCSTARACMVVRHVKHSTTGVHIPRSTYPTLHRLVLIVHQSSDDDITHQREGAISVFRLCIKSVYLMWHNNEKLLSPYIRQNPWRYNCYEHFCLKGPIQKANLYHQKQGTKLIWAGSSDKREVEVDEGTSREMRKIRNRRGQLRREKDSSEKTWTAQKIQGYLKIDGTLFQGR